MENVSYAWNLNEVQEIIYFILSCFGKSIDTLNFFIEADKEVPILQMEMFEVEVNNTNINRIPKGLLQCMKNSIENIDKGYQVIECIQIRKLIPQCKLKKFKV